MWTNGRVKDNFRPTKSSNSLELLDSWVSRNLLVCFRLLKRNQLEPAPKQPLINSNFSFSLQSKFQPIVSCVFHTEYGGLGLDYTFQLAFLEELGEIHCGAIPMAIGVQTDMSTPALTRFGSEELKQRFLVPVIKGEQVSAIAVSEAGGGSDVSGM